MNQGKMLPSGIMLLILLILVAGCGGSAVEPQPGATFAGPLENSVEGANATANDAELEIVISNDGAGIVSAGYSVMDTVCTVASGGVVITSGGWSVQSTPVEPVPIENGKIEFDFGDMIITGEFTSSTEANGTVKIMTEERGPTGQSIECDFGTWEWSGEVK